ncbi:gamma-glutamyl phosphate reductase [Tumebacillus flagellatus]|uniref:Gamma-glutamyl phosphate reductase n=1 Tax=Tumebacillus flagellatus TaxID=1157490 RepID=A0A074LUZ6_9BACL|nr:gamma-glutamyl phosphate reductase [Tumebacillus flagellatus]
MVLKQAESAQNAAKQLRVATTDQKNEALRAMGQSLWERREAILAANALDVAEARETGQSEGRIDRLALDEKRMQGIIEGLQQVAALPDPVGEVIETFVRADGLRVEKVRVPLGVIAMIYESRPNVTVDAAGLTLKTGNAVILRGGREALRTNVELVAAMREGVERAGLTADAIQLINRTERETVDVLIRARGLVDLVIPRGGAELINRVVENSRVPVIETGVGNCHVYVDAEADLAMAKAVILNAKTQRPSVCNAMETLLVHEAVGAEWLRELAAELAERGVEIRGCERTLKRLRLGGEKGTLKRFETDAYEQALEVGDESRSERTFERVGEFAGSDRDSARSRIVPAAEADWSTEFLDLILAVKVVDSLDDAVEHIGRYGTQHSEAIITGNESAAQAFLTRVDAAAVYHNASTRFTDGFEFGFGAEIGISTQKLHARGPMGLRELTSSKYILRGTGQIR